MTRTACIVLPNGRCLDYEIRVSGRAKSLRLKMTVRDGLMVITPKGLSAKQVAKLVTEKRAWIATRLEQFDEVRNLLGQKEIASPEAFDLPALAETWRVEYRQTKSKNVGARTDRHGRIMVSGAVDESERCKGALRRWLARRAKETLVPLLESISAASGLRFNSVSIKSQRTRWGSCSASGVISLNAKLLFLSPALVRYVLMHELCHNLERNHTIRFWTHLRQFETRTDLLHGQMRDAWKMIPVWAHPVKGGCDGL